MPRQRNEAPTAPRLTFPKFAVPKKLDRKRAALFTDMLEGWWNNRFHHRRHKEESVLGDIRTVCDLVGHASKIPGQLTPADFDRWAMHLATERCLTERTQSKYYAVVRGFLDYVIGKPGLRDRVRKVTGADVRQLITPETGILHKVPKVVGPDTGRRAFTHEPVPGRRQQDA